MMILLYPMKGMGGYPLLPWAGVLVYLCTSVLVGWCAGVLVRQWDGYRLTAALWTVFLKARGLCVVI